MALGLPAGVVKPGLSNPIGQGRGLWVQKLRVQGLPVQCVQPLALACEGTGSCAGLGGSSTGAASKKRRRGSNLGLGGGRGSNLGLAGGRLHPCMISNWCRLRRPDAAVSACDHGARHCAGRKQGQGQKRGQGQAQAQGRAAAGVNTAGVLNPEGEIAPGGCTDAASGHSPSKEDNILQLKYGSEHIKFESALGIRTAELSIADGSTCRVLIDGVRVSSYRATQWHGGQEDALFSVLKDANSPEDECILQGGMVLSFPGFGGMILSGRQLPWAELAARGMWDVVSASSNMGKETSVLLGLNSSQLSPSPSGPYPWSAGLFSLQYCLTLSSKGLTATLRAKNHATRPLFMAPSIGAHIAVASLDGAFLMGCQGHSFVAPGDTSRAKEPSQSRRSWNNIFGWRGKAEERTDMPDAAQMVPISAASGEGSEPEGREQQDGEECESEEKVESRVLCGWAASAGAPAGTGAGKCEQDEYSGLRRGLRRFFPLGPTQMSLVDRGFRRSFAFEGTGFQSLLVETAGFKVPYEAADEFVHIAFCSQQFPMAVRPGQEWEGSFTIYNLGSP